MSVIGLLYSFITIDVIYFHLHKGIGGKRMHLHLIELWPVYYFLPCRRKRIVLGHIYSDHWLEVLIIGNILFPGLFPGFLFNILQLLLMSGRKLQGP